MDVLHEEMVNLALKVQEWKDALNKLERLGDERKMLERNIEKLELDMGDDLIKALKERAEYRLQAGEHGEKANN